MTPDAGEQNGGSPRGEYVHLSFRTAGGEEVVKYEGYGLSCPSVGDDVAISNLTIHGDVLENPELPRETVGEFEVTDVKRHYMTLQDEIDGEIHERNEPIVYVTVTVERTDENEDR